MSYVPYADVPKKLLCEWIDFDEYSGEYRVFYRTGKLPTREVVEVGFKTKTKVRQWAKRNGKHITFEGVR